MQGNNERGDSKNVSGRRTVSKKKAAGTRANKKLRFAGSRASDSKRKKK